MHEHQTMMMMMMMMDDDEEEVISYRQSVFMWVLKTMLRGQQWVYIHGRIRNCSGHGMHDNYETRQNE